MEGVPVKEGVPVELGVRVGVLDEVLVCMLDELVEIEKELYTEADCVYES